MLMVDITWPPFTYTMFSFFLFNLIPYILPQAKAHSSSCWHLVLFIMFSYSTLIYTQTLPRFSRLRYGGDTWEFHLSLLLCIIYMCISFWLISFYLWLVLVFLFNRVYYGFTPLRHYTSRHYMSQQLFYNKLWWLLPLSFCCHLILVGNFLMMWRN